MRCIAVACGAVGHFEPISAADTVQVAAACCGTYGFRASAGAVSSQGVVSVNPSLEAVAWTGADMHTLQQVGTALQLPGLQLWNSARGQF